MARTRNLKPGFFTNDLLAEIEPLGRILFQGLWCHADREGRLLDRGKKLKAEILPYDKCDVEKLLEELSSRRFILRYEVEQVPYIQVVNFTKHQNPHVKEQASEIPAPDMHQTSTVLVREIPELVLPSSSNGLPSTSNGLPSSSNGRFAAPTLEEVLDYCKDHPLVDGVKFWNYYEANGWKAGRSPMRKWRAAVATWERNDFGGGRDGRNSEEKRRDSNLAVRDRIRAEIIAGRSTHDLR